MGLPLHLLKPAHGRWEDSLQVLEKTSYDHLPQDHNIDKNLAVSSSVSVDTLSCLRVWYIAKPFREMFLDIRLY